MYNYFKGVTILTPGSCIPLLNVKNYLIECSLSVKKHFSTLICVLSVKKMGMPGTGTTVRTVRIDNHHHFVKPRTRKNVLQFKRWWKHVTNVDTKQSTCVKRVLKPLALGPWFGCSLWRKNGYTKRHIDNVKVDTIFVTTIKGLTSHKYINSDTVMIKKRYC